MAARGGVLKNAGSVTFRSGPYKGVRTTNDPYDDPPNLLVEAKNIYIPDPEGSSAVLGRPGFAPALGGAQLYAGAEAFRGQCVYCHTMIDGTRINIVVHGGRMFRLNADLSTATDVTPIGQPISSDVLTRVSMVSVLDELGITDGVFTPWIASNLTAFGPWTFTTISYDGIGGNFSAQAPFYYGGAAFWPLITVNGVARTEDVAWCEPGQLGVGYQQPTFDNNWTLVGANSGPLFAGIGTNNGFYFFRQNSIGLATGTVDVNLKTSATLDAISVNVGTRSPQCVSVFGTTIYFVDDIGRPWRLVPGSDPEPIWLQLRAVTQVKQSASPITTTGIASACIAPALNKYVVAPWSSGDVDFNPPDRMYVFDARTGNYEGFWTVADTGQGGLGIEAMGVVVDNAGREQLLVVASGGYLYAMDPHPNDPAILTTEDGTQLTTEDGVLLTTESTGGAIWKDAGQLIDAYVTTGRFAYDENSILNIDRGTVVTLNDTPVRVTVRTSMMESTVEGVPDPSRSFDDTFRMQWGSDAVGRGPQITVKPLSGDAQWGLERISIIAVSSQAGPEDQ